jgi:ATP-dependent Clp protease ATP-binding subunit ClpA
MFERFSEEARRTVVQAQYHARRLGHSAIGCEHLLLGLVDGDTPAAAALHEHLLTPEHVEEQIVRLVGPMGAGRSADLDRDALAAIGVDLDQVSAVVDATFGKDALSRAGVVPSYRESGRRRRAGRRKLRPRFRPWRRGVRSGCRHRPQQAMAQSAPAVKGRYQAAARGPGGHLPLTPYAKQVLEQSAQQSRARHDDYVGAQHLALALVASTDTHIARLLSALGTSPAALISAINDRYREAS